MTITIQKLRIVAAIAAHNNLTRAAEELSITQPAVSLQIRQLEDYMGGPIVERVNKRIHLTENGELLLEAAHDILSRIERLQSDVQRRKGEVAGSLDVAVVSSAKQFMPFYLGRFLRQHPAVEPRLTVTNRASLLEAIKENRHDLYVMGQVPEDLPVQAHPFLDNPLVVVAPAGHELAAQPKIPLKRLVEEHFLVRELGSGTRAAVDRLLKAKGLRIKPFMELGSSEAIRNAVVAGLGIAVLSRHSLQLELEAGLISILDAEDFPLQRRWYVVYLRGKYLSFAASQFLDMLLSERP
jgi:DNA-binding transcriptional LysR family regulator